MSRRERRTFAEMVAEAAAAPTAPEPTHHGFTPDGRLVTPTGEVFSQIDEGLTSARAAEVLAVAAFDLRWG